MSDRVCAGTTGWAGSRWDSEDREMVRTTAVFTKYQDAKDEYPDKIIREFMFDGFMWNEAP